LILCVDDDPLVLDVTRAALERGGCRVLPAASGAEAIRALEKSPEDVALAILDLTVADMRCAHVIARLKTLRPGLKILLTSGYGRAAGWKPGDSSVQSGARWGTGQRRWHRSAG